MIEIYFLF